jgi:hypothetical protein
VGEIYQGFTRMKFKEWLLIEKTLYHGTVIDNLDSIRRGGLVGGVGDFVSSSYDELPEDELPELVFAADKQGVNTAVTAMVHHVGKKLNKSLHDVNDNDIRNHGLLIVIKNGDKHAQHRPKDDENYYGQHPHTVEPGDYYSEDMPADVFLRGAVLLRFLRRLGVWPRTWGDHTPQSEKLMRGELIRVAIAQHPEKPKAEIIKKVQGLSIEDVEQFLRKYKLNKE